MLEFSRAVVLHESTCQCCFRRAVSSTLVEQQVLLKGWKWDLSFFPPNRGEADDPSCEMRPCALAGTSLYCLAVLIKKSTRLSWV